MPVGRLAYFGVWEDAVFIGTVIYSNGVARNLAMWAGVDRFECSELVRVALNTHRTPVTRIIAITLKLLHKTSPKLRVVVSYADINAGHHGGIYQGGGWTYTGLASMGAKGVLIDGVVRNRRGFTGTRKHKFTAKATLVDLPPKHRYIKAFNALDAARVLAWAKPYPKRDSCAESVAGCTLDVQSRGDGSIPISAL